MYSVEYDSTEIPTS